MSYALTYQTHDGGTLYTHRASDDGITTGASDTPAHTHFDGRLAHPGTWSRAIDIEGGLVERTAGDIEIVNMDGALDSLAGHGFDGRAVTLQTGPAGAAYPGGYTTLLAGTMGAPEWRMEALHLTLRDRLDVLSAADVCPSKYAGNNVLPAGLEGSADDVKDQPKPKVYGTVWNVSPPCVNTSRLIYQVNDGAVQDVPAVYDGGLGLTRGSNYSSQADMETNAPAAGQYRVWLAGGYVRLGSSPALQITADVSEGANAAARTAAQIIKRIALAAGISAGSISSADIAALDAAAPHECGVWLNSGSAADAIEYLAHGLGIWVGFDRLDVLRLRQVAVPAGAPAAVLDDVNISTITRKAGALPALRIDLRHARNWTVQTDVAGAVTPARRAWLEQEWRTASATPAGVATKHPLAEAVTRDSPLAYASAATTEAARLSALLGTGRATYEITAALSADEPALRALDVGDIVRVVHARYGLASGVLLLVTRVEHDYRESGITLEVWG